jgi:hypothetical protein
MLIWTEEPDEQRPERINIARHLLRVWPTQVPRSNVGILVGMPRFVLAQHPIDLEESRSLGHVAEYSDKQVRVGGRLPATIMNCL